MSKLLNIALNLFIQEWNKGSSESYLASSGLAITIKYIVWIGKNREGFIDSKSMNKI